MCTNKINDFEIVPLSTSKYKEALEVAFTVFRFDPTAKEDIREAFRKYLFPDRYVDPGKRIHWLLVHRKTGKIAGTVGIYTYDRKEPYSLGWFGVLDEYRSLGLGKFLLQYAIDEVRQRNRFVLRIETTDLHYAQTAVALYKNLGCVELKKIPQTTKKGLRYNKLIFEKQLD